MKYTGQDKLELFVDNTQIIKKEFIWEDTMTKRLPSLLYAKEGKVIDCEAIRQCRDLIKQNTGIFSSFRGDMALGVSTLLSLSPNPHEALTETIKVYDMMKKIKFHSSDFLVIAAYQIATQSDATNYENVITRARSFYDGMKAHHFFYTSEDDYIFCAMLGLSDLDVVAGTERIEFIYKKLKDEFSDKNSVQALAQVLVLGNADDKVFERIFVLRDALKEQKIKLDKTYTLPVLGILAMLPVDIETIVVDIGVAQNTLREKKGFGVLSVTTQEVLTFVASIIAYDYTDNIKDGVLTATLSTTINNIIMAQRVAMMVMMSASTTAMASSSS